MSTRRAAAIMYGDEYMSMDREGRISRPEIGMSASDAWRVVGAVRINRFGRVVERVTLPEILAGRLKNLWFLRNGKQRWHVEDIDHGTRRTWISPKHEVLPT